MSESTLLVNCGRIVSGDIAAPVVEADSILITDGRVAEVGRGLTPDKDTRVLDVNGGTVVPGLVDSHAHPVVGDYTPRQNAVGWTHRVVHGGVTSLISAGETHWPGRTKDGIEAAAICKAAHLSSRVRTPQSARVFGGALLLDRGITEADIDDLHAAGVTKLGEIGLGSEKDLGRMAELVAHARSLGWVAPLHFGGASVPGSSVVDLEMALALKPSVISHANGGPTARPLAEVDHLIDHTDGALEVVFAGNTRVAVHIVRRLIERAEIDRLQFGTDVPSGTGVVPLGMLRLLTEAIGFGGLDPAVAFSVATGSTAGRYGLTDLGRIAPTLRADLVIIDSALGSEDADPFDSMRRGNIPAVAGVLIDGELLVQKSAATPPPTRALSLPLG